MNDNWIAIKQLDQQLLSLEKQGGYLIPRQGWVRTLRKALGMTIKQLARLLRVDPSRIVKIEVSEIDGAITMRTLQSVAEALDCKLVYSFIPNTSLEQTIKERAKKLAVKQVKRTAHTMELEAQSVDKVWLDEQVDDLTDELLRQSWKHLWEE